MQVSISHWGNSLGLRIPKSLAKSIGINSGSKVKLELKAGTLVILPISEKSFAALGKKVDLKSLVKKVRPKNMPSAAETEDTPVGREIW